MDIMGDIRQLHRWISWVLSVNYINGYHGCYPSTVDGNQLVGLACRLSSYLNTTLLNSELITILNEV